MLGAACVGAGSLLAACQQGERQPRESAGSQPSQQAAGAGAEFSCTDTSGLNDSQIASRTVNEYVDRTPNPAQTCDNCALFQPADPNQCGGCSVVAGPIHPKGWCKVWVAKPA